MFGYNVSDLQSSDTAVTGGTITGTLHNVTTGSLADYWGPGHFLALKFTDIDSDATSVLVGLDPSQGSGLVEIINDPDKNGSFKITNKDTQKVKVVQKAGNFTRTQIFDLSGLTLE